jgi:hypothetical protein
MALAALLIAFAASAGGAGATVRWGSAGAATVPQLRLFDIGVADYNGDGFLDLFTTNHKFHPSLLVNDGFGNFTDLTGLIGMGPDPAFPGLEYLTPPQVTESGLYLYATDSTKEDLPGVIHLRANGIAASGRLTFGAEDITVLNAKGGTVEVGRTPSGQPTADFDLQPGAEVDIQAVHIDLPISVSVDAPLPASSIRVGALAVPSSTNQFVLTLRDRHGYAFADLLGDAATDVFAVSGGLGGGIRLPGYDGAVQDELLALNGSSYVNSTVGSGLTKGVCRGRQAAAVDINDDDRLDLFEGCEADLPKVYLQQSRGEFESIDPPDTISTTYRWVNLGRGRRPELLAADPAGIRVFAYTDTGWQLEQSIVGNARLGRVTQFAVDDYNSDGEIDVLAVAPTGNTLLRNKDGRLLAVPLQDAGIPSKSYAASFVDYDNDGRVDLDLVPQGLLQGEKGGTFRRNGMLATENEDEVGSAITNWFDYDNDGLRDPVIATGNSPFARRTHVSRRHNLGPGGHWLEIDLQGTAGNLQAIGSRVAIRAGSHTQYGWVGQSDDSRESQGHYRLYFGLGEDDRVRKLAVRWADGKKTTMRDLPADRLITVAHP